MPKEDALIELVLSRLERISADSPLAHRASGLRGSLLRALEQRGKGSGASDRHVDESLRMAFEILNEAAGGSRQTPPEGNDLSRAARWQRAPRP
jgi:hypothetical protein